MKDSKISKYISYLLRHHPETANLTMDEYGFVESAKLVAHLNETQPFAVSDLDRIVSADAKGRYEFSVDNQFIRAVQGHSISVCLELTPVVPPQYLYHGTGERLLADINKSGILKMSRQYVHLSADVDTARTVGSRHGKPAILLIDTARMGVDGYKFFQAANGVWLSESDIESKYFERVS